MLGPPGCATGRGGNASTGPRRTIIEVESLGDSRRVHSDKLERFRG